MDAPCKSCKTRSVKCHGTCEKYKQYRMAVDDQNEQRRKRFAEDAGMYRLTVVRDARAKNAVKRKRDGKYK